MRHLRCTIAAGTVAAALAVPGLAAAKPIVAFPTSNRPSVFQETRCNRWGNELTRIRDTHYDGAASPEFDKAASQAMDDGCAVIF